MDAGALDCRGRRTGLPGAAIVSYSRWPTFGDHLWLQIGLYALVLLGLEAWLFAHRRDLLAFDADGFTITRAGRTETVAWSSVETFWLDWTKEQRGLRLVADGRTFTVPLDLLAADVDAARRLRGYLEPLWQRKLQGMAASESRPSKPLTERIAVGACGIGAVLMLAFAVPPTQTAADRATVAGFALLFAVLGVALWRVDKLAAGPGTVRAWGRRIGLGEVETITVKRTRAGEVWILRGGRRRVDVGQGVDFPLVAEHILRHCRHAAFEYLARTPRTDLEAVFLPVPPGGAEAMGETVPATRAQDRERLLQVAGTGLGLGLMMAMLAVVFTYMARDLARQQDAWRTDAIPVTAEVLEGGPPWRVRYQVGTRPFEQELVERGLPAADLRGGRPVTLRYLPGAPGMVLLEGQELPNPVPMVAVYAMWLFVVAMLASGVAAGVKLLTSSPERRAV